MSKLTVTYEPVLVLLSIGVAILGSLTALALTSLSDSEEAGAGQRSFALTSGGLIMGATIWSMHFVAMMAVDFPVVVNYNLIETVGSIGIAIVATGFGLYLASTRSMGWLSIPLGGVLMGGGIAGMHYLGMSAIRGCGLGYDATLVAASIAIAIVASMAALWFAFYKRNIVMTAAGGVVQGLAIASMHYTAMAATYFAPLGADVQVAAPLFSQSRMAYMIAAGIVIISAVNLTMVALMSREEPT
jgi:diguanylate cyclase